MDHMDRHSSVNYDRWLCGFVLPRMRLGRQRIYVPFYVSYDPSIDLVDSCHRHCGVVF